VLKPLNVLSRTLSSRLPEYTLIIVSDWSGVLPFKEIAISAVFGSSFVQPEQLTENIDLSHENRISIVKIRKYLKTGTMRLV
jgi:hypothetical protein